MVARVVLDGLRRVQAKTVELKLVDPIAGVRNEEFAYRSRIGVVKIDGVAPFVLVPLRGVMIRELRKVVAVGTEMVVDDVEKDAHTLGVRPIDKAAKVVGATVQPRRRKQVHAVVAPTKLARKI